jgi:hypothetical protein
MAIERLEIGRLIVRGSLLPTPIENTNPFERQGPHGGLMGFPLVALLLVRDLRPERMPDRLSRPLYARLADELWTLEAPMDPGFLAAAFRHWRDAGVLLECSGGRIACPLFAEGDEEPGGKDGARTWKGLEQGEIGMALGTLGDGVVEGLNSVQGDTELADQGLDAQDMRGDDARIAGQRRGRFYGLDTFFDDVSRASVVVAEEGLKGRAPCELCRFEGRPATQKVTKDRGVFILKPLQHVRKIIFQGTRETIGDPHAVVDHTAAVFDALCQGAHRGALWLERLQLIAMGQQQFELECGICGVVFGPAGGKGFTIPCQCQRIDGKEHQKVIRAQGGDNGPFVELEAYRNGVAIAPRAQRADPRVDGLGRVWEDEALSFGGACGLQADIMFALGPVETDEGRKFLVRFLLHVTPPSMCERSERGHASLRSAKAL